MMRLEDFKKRIMSKAGASLVLALTTSLIFFLFVSVTLAFCTSANGRLVSLADSSKSYYISASLFSLISDETEAKDITIALSEDADVLTKNIDDALKNNDISFLGAVYKERIVSTLSNDTKEQSNSFSADLDDIKIKGIITANPDCSLCVKVAEVTEAGKVYASPSINTIYVYSSLDISESECILHLAGVGTEANHE